MKALVASTSGALTPEQAQRRGLPVVLIHGGIHAIALTMVDKVFPEIAGQAGALPMSELARTYPEVHEFVRRVEKDAGARVAMICTGEATALEVTR